MYVDAERRYRASVEASIDATLECSAVAYPRDGGQDGSPVCSSVCELICLDVPRSFSTFDLGVASVEETGLSGSAPCETPADSAWDLFEQVCVHEDRVSEMVVLQHGVSTEARGGVAG